MDAGQVIEKILSDAREQAEKIKQACDQEYGRGQSKLESQLTEYNEQTAELAGKAAADKKSHMLAAARMEAAKELLTLKRRILDEVFSQAYEQVKNLSDGEYVELMRKLMLEAVETGDEEVLIDKNESRIDHKFIKMLNRELGPGMQGNLRLSEERVDIGGGFILRRGKINTNVSLGVLVEQAQKELEMEISRELFS